MTQPRSPRPDAGFTLIEVVVAISVLMAVAVAIAAVSIQGLRLSGTQQRAQIAVTVAGERMEQVQRLTASNAQLNTLVAGRTSTDVTAAWTASSAITGVSSTYPAWSTIVATPVIPITQTTTRSGSDFTSVVLIGTCYQPIAGGNCTTISGYPGDPGPTSTAASGKSQLIRVIVTVTYRGVCESTNVCRYTTSALLDTKGDLTWQTK